MHAAPFIIASLAFAPGDFALPNPATELASALADLECQVPPHEQRHTRYLTLYALPRERRPAAAAVLSFVLNSVSRSRIVALPVAVAGTDGRLWRFSLERYGLPADVWEAIASEDPYFHLKTQVVDPRTKKPKTVFTDGGWLDLAAAARLRELSHSAGAVLRGEQFIARAATTSNGGHYYRLAGVRETEAEFYRDLGIDLKTVDRLQADAGANLIRSGVTFKVRRVVRRPGPLGGAWGTYDVEQSTADRDPLRNPFHFRYDASEHIAAKGNGLHLFALFSNQGKRQDAVPDKIAKDASEPLGAGIIVPMISCVRCHVEDGLRPVANDQQRLLARGADLFTAKPHEVERLAAFYAAPLAAKRDRDAADYAQAVRTAAWGRSPAEIATDLADVYRRYVDDLVSPDQAARELGASASQLNAAARGSDDPVILSLAAGLSVQRQQWEAAFSQAAVLVAISLREMKAGETAPSSGVTATRN